MFVTTQSIVTREGVNVITIPSPSVILSEAKNLVKYGSQPKVSHEIKEQSKLTQEEWNQYFTGHWNFSGVKQDKHLAMFLENEVTI